MLFKSMETKNRSPQLQAALDAAAQATVIARQMYRRNIDVHCKCDKSPLTDADTRCETAIQEILESGFPTHASCAAAKSSSVFPARPSAASSPTRRTRLRCASQSSAPISLQSTCVLASNGRLHSLMQAVLNQTDVDDDPPATN
jgi:hypothetical protein